eukprot:TRINITY_DN15377_c0_g1_i1.p1 TRINITY_DN15377_c0_g1~~TRINITY_DN15377_c0_g1_i1.p1  ORF type:complete len:164 (-),score=22.47 TRINITY_DN15377_c0_g1_i1:12-503(-)
MTDDNGVQFNAVRRKLASAHILKIPKDGWSCWRERTFTILDDRVKTGDVVYFQGHLLTDGAIFFVGPSTSSEDSRLPLLFGSPDDIPLPLKDCVGGIGLEVFFGDALGAVCGLSKEVMQDYWREAPLCWQAEDVANGKEVLVPYQDLLIEVHSGRCATTLVSL